MKKNLQILILLFITNFTFSQNLTFDELISFRKKQITEINDFMLTKGWSFNDTKTYEDGSKSVFWSYNGQNHDSSNYWLTVYLNEELQDGIKYQTISSTTFNSIKLRIKQLGYKLTESRIEDKGLVSVYETETNKVLLKTMSRESDSSNAFVITIYQKE